jgi:mRNA-degrading endonuclease RelE of RelBE toxin-antitoxin system
MEQLAPEPRRVLKAALKDLREDHGDIRSLENPLSGYCRARVGKYRVIFRYAENMTINVVIIEERKFAYEIFEAEFARKLQARDLGT